MRMVLADFDNAFAYEALTRASSVLGDKKGTKEHLALAQAAGAKIAEQDDKDYFFSKLENVGI